MQNKGKNTVCRLCLKSPECSFEYVEAITIEILGLLGLELDLDESGRPLICRTCSENLQKCFNFKTMCLNTEDIITSFRNDRNDVKLDLQEIYLRKNENKVFTVSECRTVCRLCMEIAEADCYISLNDEAKDTMSAILWRCFPELNLDDTENPVICTSCNESLYSYFNFVKNCLDMKNTIKMYCEIEESNNKPQEESKSALQFSAENLSNYKNGCTDVDIPKNCDENKLHEEIKLELENLPQIESQESHIKHEVNEHEEVDDVNVEKLSNAVEKCQENQQNGETELKCENLVETESHCFNIKCEEIDIKPGDEDTARFQASMLGKVKRKDDFQRHMLIHKDASEVTMYSCGICTYRTKRKGDLIQHILIHKDASEVTMYSCEICTYKTKLKSSVTKHMLIHKDASEVTMYSCGLCTYKTKRKGSLKLHLLIHKDASEVTIYSCGLCTYKSKQKSNLTNHMLIHKDVSEVTMCSCGICTFKSKHKRSLKNHMLIHKSASEVTTYSCGICTYKAKLKRNLTRHMLIHADASEVTMYSCGICTYKAKQKSYLRKHMLIHKVASTYSCGICTYKAKKRIDLKRHIMLIHAVASEVTTYSCRICTYKAKKKGNLKQHMLIHKDASEVTMYSCEMCTYKAKHKRNLTQHILTHKDASEVTMYSCGICTYKTKLKSCLTKHMLIHKDASEVTMYSCGMCTYKSKRKDNLKQHTLIHKGASEVKCIQNIQF